MGLQADSNGTQTSRTIHGSCLSPSQDFGAAILRGSRLGNDTAFHHFGFVLKDSHGGVHPFEAKFGVKAFFPRVGIQDDLSVAFGETHKVLNDLFPQAVTLIVRMDRDVTQIGTILPVRQASPGAYQLVFMIDKTLEFAIGENQFKEIWWFCAKGGNPVQLG
jgi:hypothetical protein